MSDFTAGEINTYKFYWLDAHDVSQPAAVKGAEIIKDLQEQLEHKDEELKSWRRAAENYEVSYKQLKARNEKLERVAKAVSNGNFNQAEIIRLAKEALNQLNEVKDGIK